MSSQRHLQLAGRKRRFGGLPIVMLSCYHPQFAALADDVVDVLLVGDSLATSFLGKNDTLSLSLDFIITCAEAVVQSTKKAPVVCDLPFSTYEASFEDAFCAAQRVLKSTGCHAVKIEGGAVVAPTVQFLTARGIPVVAHVGVQPQHVRTQGGYRARNEQSIINDAQCLAAAGAICCVLECVDSTIAQKITDILSIPTIGIASSHFCDGQVIVADDLLSLSPQVPAFVRPLVELKSTIKNAFCQYADAVRFSQRF